MPEQADQQSKQWANESVEQTRTLDNALVHCPPELRSREARTVIDSLRRTETIQPLIQKCFRISAEIESDKLYQFRRGEITTEMVFFGELWRDLELEDRKTLLEHR